MNMRGVAALLLLLLITHDAAAPTAPHHRRRRHTDSRRSRYNAREQPVHLGAGLKLASRGNFSQLQRDIACWDAASVKRGASAGEWQLDPDPQAWMGARSYINNNSGHIGRRRLGELISAPPPPVFNDSRSGAASLRPPREPWFVPVNYSLAPSALHALPHRPYVWRPPPTCYAPLQPFNRAAFCAALGGRSLLLLGDSLTSGMHDALVELLGGVDVRYEQPHPQYCPGRLRRGAVCEGHAMCGGRVQLRLRRSDQLLLDGSPDVVEYGLLNESRTRVNVEYRVKGSGSYELPVDDLIPGPPGKQYDVVVINRGLHYRSTPVVLRELAVTLRFIIRGGRATAPAPRAYRRPLIIFRSSASGHHGCAAGSKPLTRAQYRQGAAMAGGKRCPYNWCAFDSQNAAVAAMLAAKFPGVVYMDVTGATSLRPDMHSRPPYDCLHYRGMGAYDHWVRMLQNVVQLAVARG